MYSNNFVICVTVNNKPQKELPNGVVELPFGAEYALRFRNKNNKRALVEFSIDGEVVSGPGYIIDANGVLDIERFHDVANKFRFVPLDSDDAIDYGKNGRQDGYKGLIEAKFYLEKEIKKASVPSYPPYNPYRQPYDPLYPYNPYNPPYPTPYDWRWRKRCFPHDNIRYGSNSLRGCSGGTKSYSNSNMYDEYVQPMSGVVGDFDLSFEKSLLNDGVTVEGGGSDQSFRPVHFEADMSNPTVIKVFLQGYSDEKFLRKKDIEDQIKQLQAELKNI